jgi:hypothetical protein
MAKAACSAFLVFVTILGLSSFSCAAQETAAPALAKARELIEITGAIALTKDAMRAGLKQQIELQRQTNTKVPGQFWDEFGPAFNEEMEKQIGVLVDQIAMLYAETFSEQELGELIAFYRTDVGQKAIRELPKLTQESMKFGEQWGATVGEAAGKVAAERVQKKNQ